MTPSSIRVEVNGADIHTLSPDALLLSMSVYHQLNTHSSCSLEYRQTPDRPFQLENYHRGRLKVFAVLANGTEFPIFEGWIEETLHEVTPTAACHLYLTGKGLTIDLDHQHRFYTFSKEQTLPDKLQSVIKRAKAGLTPSVIASGDLTFSRPYQLGETDWAHIVGESADLGLMVVPDGDKLFVLDKFQDSGLSLPWVAEGGLVNFEVSTRYTPGVRRGINYDREEGKSKVFAGIKDDLPRFGSLTPVCDAVKAVAFQEDVQGARDEVTIEAELLAEESLKLDSKRALWGSIRAAGESREAGLLTGRSIEITGGPAFSGKYGVTRVTHQWNPGSGYRNSFDATPFDSSVGPPMDVIPPFLGTIRARVVSVPNRDSGRIQIKFPWEEEIESLWWPWLAPYAGPGRGLCFPPEIGDEVVVAFHSGDTRKPYIVAAAWNGSHPMPLEDLFGNEVDKNDIKRLVTKSGNRLVMDDKDGKEAIVMATPKHVRVSLFDGGSTLLLHSDGNIHIHAGGTVHMKCAQFLREIG